MEVRGGLCEQNAEGATCHARQFAVSATGENDRNPGSHHDSRGQRASQLLKLLEEYISGFQIGDH